MSVTLKHLKESSIELAECVIEMFSTLFECVIFALSNFFPKRD